MYKSFNSFLEALRDEITPIQASAVERAYGKTRGYLDSEPAKKTDKIPNGKWKLTNNERDMVIGSFFDVDLQVCKQLLNGLSDNFVNGVSQAVIGKYKNIFSEFNLREPSLQQVHDMFENCFYQLNAKETEATKKMVRDHKGKPVFGEDNKPMFVDKAAGELVFTNNKTNINGFVDSWNKAFPKNTVSLAFTEFLNRVRNIVHENKNIVEFNIFADKPMYLYITDKPSDILNMSVTNFYTSCQDLYSGSHREQLLMNVFEKNSKPAFLILDEPFYVSGNKAKHSDYRRLKGKKLSDFTAVSRRMIRYIEETEMLYFDRAYPDRMEETFDEILDRYVDVERHTGLPRVKYKQIFDIDNNMEDAYHDRLNVDRRRIYGKNSKKIEVSDLLDIIANNKYDVVVDNNISKVTCSWNHFYKMDELRHLLNNEEMLKNIMLHFPHLSHFEYADYDFDNQEMGEIISFNGNLSLRRCVINLDYFNSDEAALIKNLSLISCTDSSKLELSGFTNLESLEILNMYSKLPDNFFGCIKFLKSLKTLKITDTVKLTEDQINLLKNSGITIVYESF